MLIKMLIKNIVSGRFLAKINSLISLTTVVAIASVVVKQVCAEDTIRADLPITKVDQIISNIYCIANPAATVFKAYERLVKYIDVNAFVNCTKLNTINVNSNHLKTIYKGTFGENLNKLEVLDIGNNRIEYLHHDTFKNLTSIKVLELWDNFLHGLHKDTFQKNINLEKLLLYGNQLEYIHEDTFANLINLKVLHIDNNNLHALDPNVIRNLANLEDFFFYSNEIPTIDQEKFMRHLPKIKEVNFNNNDLSCPKVDRIVADFSKKPDLNITTFVWSNPRRPDATNTTQGDFYCVNEDMWESRQEVYRQRAVRAEIFFDLQMSMDEQRDVIDEVKVHLHTFQIQYVAETKQLTANLNTAMKEMADLKFQISQLKLTNLELLNSKVKLEEEYRSLKFHSHENFAVNMFGGTVSMQCKVEAQPSKYSSLTTESNVHHVIGVKAESPET